MDTSYPTPAERLKEVTDKLEAGVIEVFEGQRLDRKSTRLNSSH